MVTSQVVRLARFMISMALVAWVGGQIALGAYSARFAFQLLSRAEAGRLMTQVFRSFDGLIIVAMAFCFLGLAVDVFFVRRVGRLESVGRVGVLLVLFCGMIEVFYLHPWIVQLFEQQRTQQPIFEEFHRWASRVVQIELVAASVWFLARSGTTPSRESAA